MLELFKLLAALVTLIHILGPWGSLALVAAAVAIIVGLYANGEKLMEWFIHREIRAIGMVMKDATVTIHSVTPAPEPDPSVWRTGDDEDDEMFENDLEASGMPEGDYEWFKIDATIDPKPVADGGPTLWEPTMIQVRKNDGKSRHALELDIDCLIAQVECWQDGGFVVFDHGSVDGANRIRLYIGVTPGTNDVALNYLGATLGELRLPSRRHVFAN